MRYFLLLGFACLVLTSPLQAEPPASSPPETPPVLDCGNSAPEACGSRIWGGAEYLLWWVRDMNTPPLVTTGNPHDAVPGALGQPGTVVLFGDKPLDFDSNSGVRFTIGGWLDPEETWGLEGSGFLLERRSVNFAAQSDAAGNPPLYVPFFRVPTNAEGSLTLADPLFGFAGGITVQATTELFGGELNLLRRVSSGSRFTADLLAGVRYLQLRENLVMNGNLNDFIDDIQAAYTEGFSTRNEFWGGQLGARGGYQWGSLGVDATVKVALGNTTEQVVAFGTVTQGGPGAPFPGTVVGTSPGGAVFVQPSNLGSQTHGAFSVVPQVQGQIHYDFGRYVRATVGYDYLYWSNVVRPGDQIGRVVNDTQAIGGTLVGAARPAPQFNHTDFYAHGVSFGLEFRY
jgi:Putative beta barrel porin-7 (BBP7)